MQKYVEIEFNGVNKLLRYDFNAIADLESQFGKSISAIFTEENFGFNALRVFFWAGLKWKDRGLTIERTGDMLYEKIQNGSDMEELMGLALKALDLSGLLGKQKDGVEGEPTRKNKLKG